MLQILLLENTRFHAGDEGNDDDFAKALAHGADAFVNDAFGVCHRNQGSVTGVCSHVPKSYMGLLIKAELESMVAALDNPKRSDSPKTPKKCPHASMTKFYSCVQGVTHGIGGLTGIPQFCVLGLNLFETNSDQNVLQAAGGNSRRRESSR